MAGLVLVDGRSEDMDAFYGAEGMQGDLTKIRILYTVFGFLDRIGVVRLFGPALLSGQGAGMAAPGPEGLAAYAHFAGRPSTAETSIAEYVAWQQSNAELAEAGTSLGDLPLVVLTHGKPLATESEEAAWQAAQAKQASLSVAGSPCLDASSSSSQRTPSVVARAIHYQPGEVASSIPRA
jgi:hypothetical protein